MFRDGGRSTRARASAHASITSRQTGRKFVVEVKERGPQGSNAEERGFKHHTGQFDKLMHDRYGYDWTTTRT